MGPLRVARHLHRARRVDRRGGAQRVAEPGDVGAEVCLVAEQGRAPRQETDPLETTEKGGTMTPLGGSPEGSSHKGYGLSAMVNILGACLSGSTLIASPMHMKQPHGQDIGHFCYGQPGSRQPSSRSRSRYIPPTNGMNHGAPV